MLYVVSGIGPTRERKQKKNWSLYMGARFFLVKYIG